MIPLFILLTDSDDGTQLIINVNRIDEVYQDDDNITDEGEEYSTIVDIEGNERNVTESPEEIFEMIQKQLRRE